MKTTSLRHAVGLTSAIAMVIGGVVATTSVAHAAPGESDACPAVHPAAELTLGQQVTGLTTAGSYRKGGVDHDSTVTPEQFTGFYRGTIEDEGQGNLYVFELEGSRITKADGDVDAGVWSGISGSPLYASDGSLVGSVSYSFGSNGASRFAGVTPAQRIYDVLPGAGAPGASPRKVALSSHEKASLRREGVPASDTTRGLTRLDPVTSVSGFRAGTSAPRILAAKAGRRAPQAIAGAGSSAREFPIVPGGNLAASDSYGTISSYAVGTTTAVCGDDVFAFGHPNSWAPSSETIHGAETVFIQDSGAASFKVANPGAPAGTLTADRLNGIAGRLGPVPATTTVSSSAMGARTVTGLTHVSNADALSFVVASQAYRDAALALDQDAGGESALEWTITYRNQAGQAKSFTRSQRYSARSGLGLAVTSDVASDVETILDNPFENVTITKVKIADDVNAAYRALKVGRVQYRAAGTGWRAVADNRRVTLRPGGRLKLRVSLIKADKYSTAAPTTVNLDYPLSTKAVEAGQIRITGNSSSFDEGEEFDQALADFLDGSDSGYGAEDEDDPFARPVPAPRNLPQLLSQLGASPRQDDVTSSLNYFHRSSGIRTSTRKIRVPSVVSGDFILHLRFRK